MDTTAEQAHDRRQMLLLASVAALTLQACLGLIAYPAAPVSMETGLSLGSPFTPALTAGAALHYLHPTLSTSHKVIGALLIGVLLSAGIGGLDSIEHAQDMSMVALRVLGRGAGMLATGLFWMAMFAGTRMAGRREE
ncbi:hypothetical protein [Kocuria nitroreducens]|uniref:hypothetical protein n=1 Tax=Kocuria nitroreducens TaxID=3058914 RepID=UPI0036DEDC4D